jgi:hypothetical protein
MMGHTERLPDKNEKFTEILFAAPEPGFAHRRRRGRTIFPFIVRRPRFENSREQSLTD